MPFVHPSTWSVLITRIFIILACIFALTTTCLQLYNTAQIRATQVNGTPTGKAILETNEQIKSCLQATGDCYKASRQNQIAIISTMSDRQIYAILCVRRTPEASVEKLKECVDKMALENK